MIDEIVSFCSHSNFPACHQMPTVQNAQNISMKPTFSPSQVIPYESRPQNPKNQVYFEMIGEVNQTIININQNNQTQMKSEMIVALPAPYSHPVTRNYSDRRLRLNRYRKLFVSRVLFKTKNCKSQKFEASEGESWERDEQEGVRSEAAINYFNFQEL